MTNIITYSSNVIEPSTVTISDGETDSAEVNCFGTTITGVGVPASFGTTSVKFKVSNAAGGTYYTLRDEFGLDLELTVDSSTAYVYGLGDYIKYLMPYDYVKLVAGSAVSGDTELDLFFTSV